MNQNLSKAKRNKNDEFYTKYEDVEEEVRNYWGNLNNKIVYCNTDNYKHSNFVKYFLENFKKIGLKKLISLDLNGSYFEYDGLNKKYYKFKNGDFRGKHSTNILKSVDIVITNPPFSLFRDYLNQLIKYNKEFLIVGNLNAVAYKEVFPLIKNNKVWLGYNSPKRFIQPSGEIKQFGNILWFTNLYTNKRYKKISLDKYYKDNEDKYPKYDNYDAIEVGRVANIPKDYYGVMGVPITFLTKHNPNQFNLVGLASGNSRANNFNYNVSYNKHDKDRGGCGVVDGQRKYARVLIKRNNIP